MPSFLSSVDNRTRNVIIICLLALIAFIPSQKRARDGFTVESFEGNHKGIITLGDYSKAEKKQKHPIDAEKYVTFSILLPDRINSQSPPRTPDFDYLAPIVARNWWIHGWHPIIVVLAPNHQILSQTLTVWNTLMHEDTLILPIVVTQMEDGETAVDVSRIANIARLYVAHLVSYNPDAYLRVIDNDRLVLNPSLFLPRTDSDILIYNGHKFKNKEHFGTRICHKYPTHSTSMKIKHWRLLLELEDENLEDEPSVRLPKHVMQTVLDNFGSQSPFSPERMAEIMLGCAVDDGVDQHNLRLHLAHTGTELQTILKPRNRKNHYVDVNLSNFRIQKHGEWLNAVVNNTNVLTGFEQDYRSYTEQWQKQYPYRLRG